ncbi:PAC2 family protein [Microbacterium gorillae]|uniref:PAC2 family protein n=1 Tax=Microbacterium gorillae TaxID=1231063 RepID=UPI00058C90A3|nr:PAC2 family protein [Microbacterium gorillae]
MQGLGRRILVAAFDGWNDAGEAASTALAAVRDALAATEIWQVEPELYFDFQYTRPSIGFDESGARVITWPSTKLWRAAPADEGGTELWLLTGVEPARAWQAFCAEIVDQALTHDISGFIALGSMMSDVPHTRPIRVHGSSDDPEIRRAGNLERSEYEGPVGILTVLSEALAAAEIPTVNLWASVPHYTAGHAPAPKATLAVLDALIEYTGREVPRAELVQEADRWEAAVDAAVAEDEELVAYVAELERARDEWDALEASGESIAQEFEKYLRSDGDGPPRR